MGWFGGFGGIRQPWGSADAGGYPRARHLWEEALHQCSPLEGLRLAEVASEDAPRLPHTSEGVHAPEASGFKIIHSAHRIKLVVGTPPAPVLSLYLTDQAHK